MGHVLITRSRRVFLGLLLVTAAGGYAIVPPSAADAAARGMTLGGVPTARAPTSATIVIGNNAQAKGYKTKVVTISQGGSLNVVNLDMIEHTVTSDALSSSGRPLFDQFVSPGATTSIPAASKLAAGTYIFHCQFHPTTMIGKLIVEGGSGGGTHPVPLKFEQPLKLPKVLTGSQLRIPIERAKVRILPHGRRTPMWTYDGSYPGPTIRRPAGHDTKITFIDRLPKADGRLSVHLHGDHHSSASDGQPDSHLIHHHGRRTYNYPLTDHGRPERAAFDFYHDHRMNLTGRNNWHGLQGMFIIDGSRTRSLRLPRGQFDLPLQIADRSFTAHNRLTNPFPRHASMVTKGAQAPPGDGTVGNQILVDGRFAPYKYVSTHRYRLRLLNSSNFSTYDFALSDGRPFVQIGTGDGLLPKPVVRQDILLGPAQRADVIVDFHGELHQRVVLDTIAGGRKAPVGIGARSAEIMQFRVHRAAKRDRTRLPSRLEQPPAISVPKHVSAVWTFGLGGTPKTGSYWTVNGKPFDPKRVDHVVRRGSTQTWLLRNMSPITHFIHIHEEQWHTVSRDGKPPPAWERGLEDTWRLDPGERVKVAAKFTDYTGVFMLHCHMLAHEDHGMMAQFAVVKRDATHLPAGYYLTSGRYGGAQSEHATSASASASMPMDMDMPMTAAMRKSTGLPALPASNQQAGSTSLLARDLSRWGRALALELAALVLLLGWRRYRPQARLG
jgi:spore coat protein A, manganese oxidase